MKHISVKYRYLQDAITNQRSMVAKSGHETQRCRRFDKGSQSTSAKEHFDHTENRVVGNYHTCVHQLDRGHKYSERADRWTKVHAGSPGRQSKYWPHEHREGFGNLVRASWCAAERIGKISRGDNETGTVIKVVEQESSLKMNRNELSRS